MDVRRSVHLTLPTITSTPTAPLLAVSEDAVAHLHQASSQIHVHGFLTTRDSSQSAAKLSMACSVDIPAFRSTEVSDDDAPPEPRDNQKNDISSQLVPASDQGEATLHAAPLQPPTANKRLHDMQSPQPAKRARTSPSPTSGAHLQAVHDSENGPTVQVEQPVWQEELSPLIDHSNARLSRVNALAACSLRVCSGGEQQRHCIVCAAGVLALPTSLVCTQQLNDGRSECTAELVPSTMVWVVPMHDGAASKDAMHAACVSAQAAEGDDTEHELHASCLLVDNDEITSLHAASSALHTCGVQSVSVQPVGEGDCYL